MEPSLEFLLPIVPDFAGFSMEVLGTAIENMGKRGRQDPGSNLCHWLWDLISGDRNAFFIIPFPAHAAVIVHVGWLFENYNNTPSSGSVLQETEPEVWLLVTGEGSLRQEGGAAGCGHKATWLPAKRYGGWSWFEDKVLPLSWKLASQC